MSNKNDGGPAFPISPEIIMRGHSRMTVEEYEASPLNKECGMTLRDWFAGMALIALRPNADSVERDLNDDPPDFWAGVAYDYADSMLEARGK